MPPSAHSDLAARLDRALESLDRIDPQIVEDNPTLRTLRDEIIGEAQALVGSVLFEGRNEWTSGLWQADYSSRTPSVALVGIPTERTQPEPMRLDTGTQPMEGSGPVASEPTSLSLLAQMGEIVQQISSRGVTYDPIILDSISTLYQRSGDMGPGAPPGELTQLRGQPAPGGTKLRHPVEQVIRVQQAPVRSLWERLLDDVEM